MGVVCFMVSVGDTENVVIVCCRDKSGGGGSG